MIKFVVDDRIRRTNCEELQIDFSGIHMHTTQSNSQYSEWKPWRHCTLIKVATRSQMAKLSAGQESKGNGWE